MRLADADRKDARARTVALNSADMVILCLPDEAARDAVALIDNPSVRVSTRPRASCRAGLGLRLPEMEPGTV